MRHGLKAIVSLSVLIPLNTFALQTISGEISGDYFFDNGVMIDGVHYPEENVDLGASSVVLEGVGSIVVANRKDGNFPRLSLIGGTVTKNYRDWSQHADAQWWDGYIQAPHPKRKVALSEISELEPLLNKGIKLESLAHFQFGTLENEKFVYSLPARVALPVEALDGEKIFIAQKQDNGAWEVNRETVCLAYKRLCIFDVKEGRAVALFKRAYEVAEGGFADTGEGDFSLESYAEGSADTSGLFDLFDDVAAPPSVSGGRISPTKLIEQVNTVDNTYKNYYKSAIDSKEIPKRDQRSYHLQYLGTNVESARFYDEGGLSSDELAKVRELNAGRVSRRLRKDPEPEPVAEDEGNSRFLDYLFAMRNKFGEGEQANVFGETMQMASADMMSASQNNNIARLPSTGPGLFMILAGIGFCFMVIGAMRRA